MEAGAMGSGICGNAVTRAADAMLRSLGGEEISLLLPLTGMAADAAGELGLVDPGVEELKIAPVIARALATDSSGPRRRVEFLVPASGVMAAVSSHNFTGAEQLMEAALGIVYEGDLFHIEGFTSEYFGAAAYLYRVTGVE
jgi:hypothetical protein